MSLLIIHIHNALLDAPHCKVIKNLSLLASLGMKVIK